MDSNPYGAPPEKASCNRILIAEDNLINYKLVETVLRRDYSLGHASDGAEAVELFRRYGADLVVMDIYMAGMDGFEVLRQIRALAPHVPVIALSSYAYGTDRQRILEAGFNDFMARPSVRELHARIAELLAANR